MGRLRTTVILSIAVGAGAITSAFAQQPIQGRSADLGFSFEVLGGNSWCRETVNIVLDANDASTYENDEFALDQALGRLRAIVTTPAACRKVREIKIDARAKGKTVYRATMASYARWLAVWEDADKNEIICFGPTRTETCSPFAQAFRLMQEAIDSGKLPDIQLVSFLDARRSAQVEWKMRGVVGQVRLIPAAQLGPDVSTELVAEALITNAQEDCPRGWGVDNVQQPKKNAFRRAFRCSGSGKPVYEELIITQRGGAYFIFASRFVGRDPKPIRDIGDVLIQYMSE